ncbi:DUF3124 domain-containing protein [Planctomicrobium piriforme]|uniref:DUF3124 domain-containing protein n=1 Tax=Planctomicrobium piriforme TaxID=1576369 RepID=A0A1I3TCM3_9PLAN|nr:DUF3124 domain-containing protein [Planctomicrobium piriforme]SFJ68350.1 Protein of unknown function [Planctomicrobium piriforme]
MSQNDQSFQRSILLIAGIGVGVLALFAFFSNNNAREAPRATGMSAFQKPVSDVVADPATAAGELRTHFVPAYSHIYVDSGQPFRLTVTLSFRNTDPQSPLTIHSVRYYDTAGKLIRDELSQPLIVAPLGTKEFLVAENDFSGGSGANFLIDWSSGDQQISTPLAESIMIGTAQQQGVSFASRGVEVTRRP